MGRKSKYSEAYKREAVTKAKASGNVSQTARELGISNKSLHGWIKRYGDPLDVETASAKELAARVRQLERQLAMREGQIEVLKHILELVTYNADVIEAQGLDRVSIVETSGSKMGA